MQAFKLGRDLQQLAQFHLGGCALRADPLHQRRQLVFDLAEPALDRERIERAAASVPPALRGELAAKANLGLDDYQTAADRLDEAERLRPIYYDLETERLRENA